MKKFILLVLPLLIVLSGCDESIKYTKTDTTLDGNSVYYYETETEICIALYSSTIELTEDIRYEILYNCNYHQVVLLEDEYVPLTTYIRDNLVSIEDLLDSNLGIPIYYDSILNILDIDINDFIVDKISIRTLNGEFKEYGGEWTENTDLVISPDNINENIRKLMATKINEDDVCDNSMCIIFGNISPGTVYLRNDNDELRINFYGNRYEIFYENEEETIRVYNIPITSENDSLINEIMEVYNNLY